MIRRALFGPPEDSFRRRLDLLFAATVSVATFAAYALDLFSTSGGVIWLPADAAIVGAVAAAVVGRHGGGLLFAWLAAFASLFGFNAEWAVFGLSSHSTWGKIAFLLDPESIAVFSVAAVVLGTAGFALGYLVRLAVAFLDDAVSGH